MRELFVYYRVRAAQAGAARRTALAFQAELGLRYPALTARLLRRDEGEVIDTGIGKSVGTSVDKNIDKNASHDNDRGRDATWMETYLIDPRIDAAGVSAALQAEIEAAARVLEPFLNGTRHTEVFIACASR